MARVIEQDAFGRFIERDAVTSTPIIEQRVATVAMSGHRAVAVDAAGGLVYADNTTAVHAWATVGILNAAVLAGGIASAVVLGELTEPSWTWTPQQPVFLGVNGLLTQTPPTHPAFCRVVAVAVTATTLTVRHNPPIITAP